MTKISLKDVSASLLKSVNGKMSIGVNGSHFVDISINQGYAAIELYNKDIPRLFASKVPKHLLKLSTLRSYSKFFYSQDICLELKDEKGTLVKIGKGVSSLLEHMDVHPIRLHELMK